MIISHTLILQKNLMAREIKLQSYLEPWWNKVEHLFLINQHWFISMPKFDFY